MGFWSFLRDIFVFDWLFGNHRKGGTPTNHTDNYTTYDHDCDCARDYTPPPSSGYSRSSWDDGYYASEDYYHDSHDDYAHDFDDFDDFDDDF